MKKPTVTSALLSTIVLGLAVLSFVLPSQVVKASEPTDAPVYTYHFSITWPDDYHPRVEALFVSLTTEEQHLEAQRRLATGQDIEWPRPGTFVCAPGQEKISFDYSIPRESLKSIRINYIGDRYGALLSEPRIDADNTREYHYEVHFEPLVRFTLELLNDEKPFSGDVYIEVNTQDMPKHLSPDLATRLLRVRMTDGKPVRLYSVPIDRFESISVTLQYPPTEEWRFESVTFPEPDEENPRAWMNLKLDLEDATYIIK